MSSPPARYLALGATTWSCSDTPTAGWVVSEAASGMSEVSHLVYLAVLMLDTGEDMVEFMAAHESEVLVIGVPEGDGFVVDRARTAELLYGDSDEKRWSRWYCLA